MWMKERKCNITFFMSLAGSADCDKTLTSYGKMHLRLMLKEYHLQVDGATCDEVRQRLAEKHAHEEERKKTAAEVKWNREKKKMGGAGKKLHRKQKARRNVMEHYSRSDLAKREALSVRAVANLGPDGMHAGRVARSLMEQAGFLENLGDDLGRLEAVESSKISGLAAFWLAGRYERRSALLREQGREKHVYRGPVLCKCAEVKLYRVLSSCGCAVAYWAQASMTIPEGISDTGITPIYGAGFSGKANGVWYIADKSAKEGGLKLKDNQEQLVVMPFQGAPGQGLQLEAPQIPPALVEELAGGAHGANNAATVVDFIHKTWLAYPAVARAAAQSEVSYATDKMMHGGYNLRSPQGIMPGAMPRSWLENIGAPAVSVGDVENTLEGWLEVLRQTAKRPEISEVRQMRARLQAMRVTLGTCVYAMESGDDAVLYITALMAVWPVKALVLMMAYRHNNWQDMRGRVLAGMPKSRDAGCGGQMGHADKVVPMYESSVVRCRTAAVAEVVDRTQQGTAWVQLSLVPMLSVINSEKKKWLHARRCEKHTPIEMHIMVLGLVGRIMKRRLVGPRHGVEMLVREGRVQALRIGRLLFGDHECETGTAVAKGWKPLDPVLEGAAAYRVRTELSAKEFDEALNNVLQCYDMSVREESWIEKILDGEVPPVMNTGSTLGDVIMQAKKSAAEVQVEKAVDHRLVRLEVESVTGRGTCVCKMTRGVVVMDGSVVSNHCTDQEPKTIVRIRREKRMSMGCEDVELVIPWAQTSPCDGIALKMRAAGITIPHEAATAGIAYSLARPYFLTRGGGVKFILRGKSGHVT
jgi:hypothetical protein